MCSVVFFYCTSCDSFFFYEFVNHLGDGADQVRDLLGEDGVDWITFTSSSTVRNLFSILDPDAVRAASVRMASIGPVTSDTLREFGIEPDVEAEEYTIPGLVDAIVSREAPDEEEA